MQTEWRNERRKGRASGLIGEIREETDWENGRKNEQRIDWKNEWRDK